jgi:hypothetical protein
MKPLIALLLFASFVVTGCAQTKVAIPPKPLEKDAATKWIGEQKLPVTFVSRNGHLYGMDSDARVTIEADGHVAVDEFGVAPMTYKGTYKFDDTGTISVKLDGYQSKWPTMQLYTTAKAAWLMRSDKKPNFNMGDRGGATETPEMAPYWPFKLVKSSKP